MVNFYDLCRKRIDDAMRRSKRENWDTVEWRILAACSLVIPIPFDVAWSIRSCFPRTRPRIASEKKGGRKKASLAEPELVPGLKQLVEDHTAGSAVEPGRVWTSRSCESFREALTEQGFSVCANTVTLAAR